MTKYATGNPVGSSDPRDLYDNAENLDNLVNGDQAAYNDRLGKSRRSWQSVEDQVNQQAAEFQSSQDSREGVFNAYLVSAGYQFAGDYAAGIEITQYNQVVRDTSGEFWRLSGSTGLPYTTTGSGLPEGGAFVYAGDAVLRNELSQNGGASLVRLAGGGTVDSAIAYVTPEMYGELGASENDNALILAALNTGLPVKMLSAEYRVNQLTWNQSADIEIGKNTIIRNMQTSGAKKPSFTFLGPGLTGAAVAVTQLGDGAEDYHYNAVTVSDASSFAVGDTVMLAENEPMRMETIISAPSMQDFNYYEFFTVESVDTINNIVSFEEYVSGEFDIGNTVTLQKAEFLEDVSIQGGIFLGGNPSGGGVKLEWVRKSTASGIKGRGLGDTVGVDRNGGPPIWLDSCWEVEATVEQAQWCLFSMQANNVQSCHIEVKGGKRTSNGGTIIGRARSCYIAPAVQDNPGDNNGDGLGISGRSWGNTFGPMTIAGARCYTIWMRQPVVNNTFMPITSMSGITAVINLFGDNNYFTLIKSRGHPSSALILEGNNNTVNLDYEGTGTGVYLYGNGNRVNGRSISLGDTSQSRDVIIAAEAKDSVIELQGGPRGLVYSTNNHLNYSNKIILRGPNPYFLGVAETGRGYVWSHTLASVSATAAVPIKVPGSSEDAKGLKLLEPTSVDLANIYVIKLQASTAQADTYSEYRVVSRQGIWIITPVVEGGSIFAPRLGDNAGVLEVSLNTSTSALPVILNIEKS